MWPYCTQDLYHSAMPVIVNMTILNGMSVSGRLLGEPVWEPANAESALLAVAFSYSDVIWPWTGYLAVSLTVKSPASAAFVAKGTIRFTVLADLGPCADESCASAHAHCVLLLCAGKRSVVEIPLRAGIVPTPPRHRRLLWDQFHNLRYPSGYFPRDNLHVKNDYLDWNGDHPHTNFRELYDFLKDSGNQQFTCHVAAKGFASRVDDVDLV